MAADLDTAPNEAYIRSVYDFITGPAWMRQRRIDQGHLELIWNEHDILTPNTNKPGRRRRFIPTRMETGEAGRIIDLLVALYQPIASMGLRAISDTVTGETVREKTEVGVNEMMDQLNPWADSPRQRDVWQIIALGRTARLGPMAGDGYWWNLPAPGEGGHLEYRDKLAAWRSHAPPPLIWIDLPAEASFPTSWGRLNDEVMSVLSMTWWELTDLFSEEEIGEALPKPENRGEYITLGIYSNREFLVYTLMGSETSRTISDRILSRNKRPDRILRTFQHGMGRSVIRILHGAVGGRKSDGRYWRSALQNVAPLIRNADRLLTLGGTDIEIRAIPPLKRIRFINPDQAMQASSDTYEPGDIWDISMDRESGHAEDIAPVIQAAGSADVLNLVLLFLQRAATISGAVEALEGGMGPSGMPAWSKNASIEVAKGKLQPMTDAVVGADLDAAEMVLLSVEQFGEEIVLYEEDRGKVVLDPRRVRGWAPTLHGEYKMRLPMNWRADLALGMDMINQAMNSGAPLSVFWIMENVMGIEQPMLQYQEWLKAQALTHPMVVDRLVGNQMEALGLDLERELGMTTEEALARLDELPSEEAKQVALQKIGALDPGGGGSNGRGPDLEGAIRAGAPFSSAPGGPQPAQSLR